LRRHWRATVAIVDAPSPSWIARANIQTRLIDRLSRNYRERDLGRSRVLHDAAIFLLHHLNFQAIQSTSHPSTARRPMRR